MTERLERREEDRADCDMEARIELDGGVVMSCRIRNLSSGGVKLQIAEAIDLPDAFDLLIPVVDGVEQRCRVMQMWRRLDMVGGRFVTPLGR